jgi:hypothetical protein
VRVINGRFRRGRDISLAKGFSQDSLEEFPNINSLFDVGKVSVVVLFEFFRNVRSEALQLRLVGVGRRRAGRLSQVDITLNLDGHGVST